MHFVLFLMKKVLLKENPYQQLLKKKLVLGYSRGLWQRGILGYKLAVGFSFPHLEGLSTQQLTGVTQVWLRLAPLSLARIWLNYSAACLLWAWAGVHVCGWLRVYNTPSYNSPSLQHLNSSQALKITLRHVPPCPASQREKGKKLKPCISEPARRACWFVRFSGSED